MSYDSFAHSSLTSIIEQLTNIQSFYLNHAYGAYASFSNDDMNLLVNNNHTTLTSFKLDFSPAITLQSMQYLLINCKLLDCLDMPEAMSSDDISSLFSTDTPQNNIKDLNLLHCKDMKSLTIRNILLNSPKLTRLRCRPNANLSSQDTECFRNEFPLTSIYCNEN
jgi:hypothetical protein